MRGSWSSPSKWLEGGQGILLPQDIDKHPFKHRRELKLPPENKEE